MHRTAVAACLAGVVLLAGCSSSKPAASGTPTPHLTANDPATPAKAVPLTATAALQDIAEAVPSAKLTGTVTAENDPNHLLGRPGQYTSKVTFADSRISKGDAEMYKTGDIELGGAVEVFSDASSARARAKYIQTVTKSMPALTEYDFVHGTVVVRVSRFLTPKQAAEYKAAAAGLE